MYLIIVIVPIAINILPIIYEIVIIVASVSKNKNKLIINKVIELIKLDFKNFVMNLSIFPPNTFMIYILKRLIINLVFSLLQQFRILNQSLVL